MSDIVEHLINELIDPKKVIGLVRNGLPIVKYIFPC